MPSLHRLALTAAAALTAVALAAGCDTVEQPAITQQQAVERVTAHAQEALQQLPPGATLKIQRDEPEMPCDDGPRTFVETDYIVDYPKGWPVERTIPTLADFWARNGYTIVKDDRASDKLPALGVEHPDDGFRILIRLTYRDNGRIDAFLISSSPCL